MFGQHFTNCINANFSLLPVPMLFKSVAPELTGTFYHHSRQPPNVLAISSRGACKRCSIRNRQAHLTHQVSLYLLHCKNTHLLAYWSKFNIFTVYGHSISNPTFICLSTSVIKRVSPQKRIIEKNMWQQVDPFRKNCRIAVTNAECSNIP